MKGLYIMTLEQRHRDQLYASGIDDTIIAERGYETFTNFTDWYTQTQGAKPTHQQEKKNPIPFPALSIPIYNLGDPTPYIHLPRPDKPRRSKDGKSIKYEWPRGKSLVFDVLPRYQQAMKDIHIPICLTEGAKKADALASIYDKDLVPVNMNGVWGWRSDKKPIQGFDQIAWDGREIWLAPDGDVRRNQGVMKAIQRLSRYLIARGAGCVQVLLLPQAPNGQKVGIDDYIADLKAR
jgi:hypothetical protein